MPWPASERRPVAGGGSETRTVRILLGEDDESMRELLAEAFEHQGYDVTQCGDGLCLANLIGTSFLSGRGVSFDAVVSDIRLPGVTGLEILRGLRSKPDRPPVVLITAFGDEATHEEAERLGAAALLDKPFEIDQLLDVVAGVIEDRRPAGE